MRDESSPITTPPRDNSNRTSDTIHNHDRTPSRALDPIARDRASIGRSIARSIADRRARVVRTRASRRARVNPPGSIGDRVLRVSRAWVDMSAHGGRQRGDGGKIVDLLHDALIAPGARERERATREREHAAHGTLDADGGAHGAPKGRGDGIVPGVKGGAARGSSGKRKRTEEGGALPGRVVVMSDDYGTQTPEGWTELTEREFADKKLARLAAVEWYSKSSSSSARLIVDKWRESKVRYVLRCQRAMPKRSEKGNKDVCKSIGSRCAMCVNIKLDKDTGSWRISATESVPVHDPQCADAIRPNVSSLQFADALEGIADVPVHERHQFVHNVLKNTGFKISSGTRQRAVHLALSRAGVQQHVNFEQNPLARAVARGLNR